MDEWISGLIGLLLGGLLGAAVTAIVVGARLRRQAADLARETRAELEAVDTRREEAERTVTALTEQLASGRRQLEEQQQLLAKSQAQLSDTFKAIGSDALKHNSEHFLKLARATFETFAKEAKSDNEQRQQAIDAIVKPIREQLDQHQKAVHELEKKREGAYRGLEQQIRSIADAHQKLGTETGRLVTALRRPEQRGRWGEMQLRNVVELAGMTRHCDFNEQVSTDDPTTRDRPDMTVLMPGGGVIVVDSKVALDAYLEALEAGDDEARLRATRRHAQQVETHVRQLANKKYWEQFEKTPKLVVMFVRLESALMAALEQKPELHSQAMENHVLIATPTLLVALLRAVAYGWQQEDIAANAREISESGRRLYERLAKFAEHFGRIGAGLERANKSYNEAIGTLERRVLPQPRELKELHATTADDIEMPPPIDVEVRGITAPELVEESAKPRQTTEEPSP